jgi:hypothetical protein
MLETLFQFIVEQFANVLDRRIFEKIVPGPVVVMSKDLPDDLFQVTEVHDHAAFRLTFDGELDFIGVSVKRTAFGMAGKKVRAIDVFGHTNPHGVRIAYGLRKIFGRPFRPPIKFT